MKAISDATLAECLDLWEQGLTVEQILSSVPDQIDSLRPFLDVVAQLSNLATQPTLAAERQSGQAMLRAAGAMRRGRQTNPPLWLALRRLLAPVTALAVLLLVVGATLLFMSASALPGDGLYGAKLFFERAHLSLVLEPAARPALLATFNEERILEVEALLRDGRDSIVRFEGPIGEIGSDHWTVAGIRVDVSDETIIEGEPRRAAVAQVHGRTHDGRLAAIRLVVVPEQIRAPVPPPEASPTATERPTPTLIPTPSPLPSINSTPAPTATPTAGAPADVNVENDNSDEEDKSEDQQSQNGDPDNEENVNDDGNVNGSDENDPEESEDGAGENPNDGGDSESGGDEKGDAADDGNVNDNGGEDGGDADDIGNEDEGDADGEGNVNDSGDEDQSGEDVSDEGKDEERTTKNNSEDKDEAEDGDNEDEENSSEDHSEEAAEDDEDGSP